MDYTIGVVYEWCHSISNDPLSVHLLETAKTSKTSLIVFSSIQYEYDPFESRDLSIDFLLVSYLQFHGKENGRIEVQI